MHVWAGCVGGVGVARRWGRVCGAVWAVRERVRSARRGGEESSARGQGSEGAEGLPVGGGYALWATRVGPRGLCGSGA